MWPDGCSNILRYAGWQYGSHAQTRCYRFTILGGHTIFIRKLQNVEEALQTLEDMPIAYNINLILADKEGNAALFETLDGVKAFRKIDDTTEQQYLHSTNHAHLQEIINLEPMAMKHSVCRYNYIENFVNQSHGINTRV